MVLPYGGTLYAFRKYLQEYILEKLAETGRASPFEDVTRLFKPCAYLSEHLWEAIKQTARAAIEAMDWLQQVADIMAQRQIPMYWTTPSGFPVLQSYQSTARDMVRTQIFGKRTAHALRRDLAGLDQKRQRNGIAPNFVHSLDAAAMMHCLVDARELGIESFSMIHDSYGTVAADTEQLSVALRYAFVNQVYNTDVLQTFKDEITALMPDNLTPLPELPKKGNLDISLVEQSDFFFA